MNEYFENLKEPIKTYFNILSSDIPAFLYDYIDTKEMQKQGGISTSCGTIYSKLFNQMWYSSLDHSVGVALIVWNFTKNKKQTLAGLFHDIATPVFKHSIDFMNGDYEKQESTERLTANMIRDSKEIMELLNRDGIKVEEVVDYHMYSIADNDTPRLSADRLEYTLSNGLGVTEKIWDLGIIKEIYEDIKVLKNENDIDEIGFKNKELAEKFVHGASQLSALYRRNKVKFSMQFLADTMEKMSEEDLISMCDLYKFTEKEIIEKIENSRYSKTFKAWRNATSINESDEKPEGKYSVSVKSKIRYIVPLVKEENKCIRINEISNIAKQDIDRALNYKTKRYAYLDFDFS